MIISLIVFSGCEIPSSDKLAEKEMQKINQSYIERQLTKNTSLEEQNITIANSIIDALNSLAMLEEELEKLNSNIEIINSNLEELQKNTTDSQTYEYLSHLNNLTYRSQEFTYILRDSVYKWDRYLTSAYENKNNLTRIKDNNSMIAGSILDPLKAWE
jgi:septal ring factor EnvC (AmiA/AmiB activator)